MHAPSLLAAFATALPELAADWQPSLPPVPAGAQAAFVSLNPQVAASLGIDADWLGSAQGLAALGARSVLPGTRPVAQAYAGHQFGGFSPVLGDGRAVLLGEAQTSVGLKDIALKGSGRTPFSRGGDGRATLSAALRELLLGEAMAGLGIPTSRALAVVATGDRIWRDGGTPAAGVLARVASSHLRVGTVEVVAHSLRPDLRADTMRRLLAFTLERHLPQQVGTDDPAMAVLEHVVEVQSALVAQWMSVGFIHGVMNTDNVALSGETIDYGPCAWMERYDENAVFSSIDTGGRYRFGAQPAVMEWNLGRLVQALAPFSPAGPTAAMDEMTAITGGFTARYRLRWGALMSAKLGWAPPHCGVVDTARLALIEDLLALLAREGADYTESFRALARDARTGTWTSVVGRHTEWVERWVRTWEGSTGTAVADRMDAVNPVYVARNHLVEEALAAAQEGDLAPTEGLLQVLANPFTPQSGRERYAAPAPPGFTESHVTYCGT